MIFAKQFPVEYNCFQDYTANMQTCVSHEHECIGGAHTVSGINFFSASSSPFRTLASYSAP
jgi:hypothetical protein